MPGGKSAHLELGYFIGSGKPGFIYFDAVPERWDVMHQFATDVFTSDEELLQGLEKYR
jgi:nucleoside 2-deoxyribosyltransferase